MKTLVLAAGEGLRLKPLTETRPKHLLPVAGRPLLYHILISIKNVHCKDVIIVIGYLGDKIKQNLGDGSKFNLKITYIWQKKRGGTGEALSLAKEYIQNEDFAVISGDLYIKPFTLKKIIQTYRKNRTSIIGVVEDDNPQNYGVVKIDSKNRLQNILEKPEKPPTNLVNTGIYIFTPTIFDRLNKLTRTVRGEIEITDAIQKLAQDEEDIYAVKLSREEWTDIGTPWNLLLANEKFLRDIKQKNVKGKVERNTVLKKAVIIEKDAIVKSGSYIEGPAYIGAAASIGPNCYIRPYTSIGSKAKIGSFCEVKNSIIMDYTKIPHLSYVGDSIIGEKCNLGAGSIVGNLRLDEKNVKMMIKESLVDTGLKKLGVIMGDNVQTGINSTFMPGVKIGFNSQIGSNVQVSRDITNNSQIFLTQQFEIK